ncbi:BnaA07g36970D [Brassica napus]|uniref:BnaA07g36970D protein n=1 Tax=Brassica napus TaxID=3708 RepID=A0A078JLC9_BRANA|nr:BnaA07g36970D [Brassica napus]
MESPRNHVGSEEEEYNSWPSNHLPNNINKHAARKNGSKQVYIEKRQPKEKTLSNEGEKSEVKARTRTIAASRVQSRGKVSKTK